MAADLTEPAKAMALDKLGNGEQGLGIAMAWGGWGPKFDG